MARSLIPPLSVLALAFGASELRRVLTSAPRYEIELRRGAFEVRRHRAILVAHTVVDRPLVASLREGYARLGASAARGPVVATPAVDGEGEGGFDVAIEVDAHTRPQGAADPRVKFDTVPPRRVAALRFRGAAGAGRVRLVRDRLLAQVAELGLTTDGEPSFATFDPPHALPLLRRSEVWVPLVAS